AAKRFRFYEEHHRAKGTADGKTKAENNAEYAVMCEQAATGLAALLAEPAEEEDAKVQAVIDRWRKFGGLFRSIECPVTIGPYRCGDSLGSADVAEIMMGAFDRLRLQRDDARLELARWRAGEMNEWTGEHQPRNNGAADAE